jgi:D-alanyl-D-alanine carboxypeptidase/D-alanyl-D-alanine-endopeptidase (penicillin-binding protein 4)
MVESNAFNRVTETKQGQLIIETSSPPLRDLVKETNLNSLNLYAECMLKEMGYKAGNAQGSSENGAKTIVDYWKKKGINTAGLFMNDGSGLSPRDGVSTGFLVDVLLAMKDSKTFYNSLPVSGQSGSMKNMGNGTSIEGNMHAKTGHMERVRSYAGYVKGKDGKMYCFALTVNNYTCSSAEIKQKIEKVLVALGN